MLQMEPFFLLLLELLKRLLSLSLEEEEEDVTPERNAELRLSMLPVRERGLGVLAETPPGTERFLARPFEVGGRGGCGGMGVVERDSAAADFWNNEKYGRWKMIFSGGTFRLVPLFRVGFLFTFRTTVLKSADLV